MLRFPFELFSLEVSPLRRYRPSGLFGYPLGLGSLLPSSLPGSRIQHRGSRGLTLGPALAAVHGSSPSRSPQVRQTAAAPACPALHWPEMPGAPLLLQAHWGHAHRHLPDGDAGDPAAGHLSLPPGCSLPPGGALGRRVGTRSCPGSYTSHLTPSCSWNVMFIIKKPFYIQFFGGGVLNVL